jgi:hypothetical protein
MNWTPHLVSIGVFAAYGFGISQVSDLGWILIYVSALVLTWVTFAFVGLPGVETDE